MQIARTLAQKIVLTAGVAAPLLSGIAVTGTAVAVVPAAPAVAAAAHAQPRMMYDAKLKMMYDAQPKMMYD